MNSFVNRRQFLMGSIGVGATACLPAVSLANESNQQKSSGAYVRCGKMCQVDLRHYYMQQADQSKRASDEARL